MKLKLSAVALGIILAYAAVPALATDTSTVNQTGNGNATNVQQIANPGGQNYSAITQTGPTNSATVLQDNNLSFNQSTINQNGTSNVGSVQQSNSKQVTAEISQGEIGNNANIKQVNVDNSALAPTNAKIMQQGQGNIGDINQHDGSSLLANINTSSFGVAGYNNQAYIDQTGQNATASIDQHNGANNYADIGQSGSWNNASIEQYGGNNNVAHTAQVGTGTGLLTQNLSTISQNGGANYAATTQWGNSKASTVAQVGNNNSTVVWQH